jgi:hypothetical protein
VKSLGESLRVPEMTCPYCGYKTDAVALMGGETHPPEAGNLSICIDCCNVSVFMDGHSLRLPTSKELIEFDKDYDLQLGIRACKITNRKRRKKDLTK